MSCIPIKSLLTLICESCSGQIVIFGHGPLIRWFNTPYEKQYLSIDCFRVVGCDVQAIIKFKTKLIVFGDKYFTLISVVCSKGIIYSHSIEPFTEVTKCIDWILSCVVVDRTIYCLLAHNQIQVFSLTKRVIHHKTILNCNVNSILYAGVIIGNHDSPVTAMCGTVFGNVLVWCPEIERPDHVNEIKHDICGNGGAIFDISFCPIKWTLATCSDDRSVRTWVFRSPPTDADSSTPAEDRYDFPQLSQWNNGKFVPGHVLFAHQARPWGIQLFDSLLISCGEDGNLYLWDNKSGKLIDRVDAGRGSIRRLAISAQENKIYCGCDSGTLFSYPITDSINPEPTVISSSIESVANVAFCFFNEKVCAIVWVTLIGEIYIKDFETNEISLLKSDPSYKYSVMSRNKLDGQIAIGSLSGKVLLLNSKVMSKQDDGFTELKLFQSKIFCLVWISDTLLLVGVANGIMQLVDSVSYEFTSNKFILPTGKQRWVSTAILIGQSALVVGDRNGSIFVYSFRYDNENGHQITTDPMQCFDRIHGRHGVTDLHLIQLPLNNNFQLHSIGRDGFIRKWKYSVNDDVVVVTDGVLQLCVEDCLHKDFEWPACFMQLKIAAKNQCCVAGFRANQFTIYSVTSDQFLYSFECGGGHRSWDVLQEDNCSVMFTYVKQGIACLVRHDFTKFFIDDIQLAPHTQKITCLAVFTHHNQVILATASEDTNIAISTLNQRNDQLNVLMKIKNHISSVQTIKVIPCTQDPACESVYILTGGGRSELYVWQMNLSDIDSDCRFIDYFVSFNTDIRILTIEALHTPNGLLVACGQSDGIVKVFSMQQNQLKPVIQSEAISGALCCSCSVDDLGIARFFFGATNGNVYSATFDCERDCISVDSTLVLNVEPRQFKRKVVKNSRLGKKEDDLMDVDPLPLIEHMQADSAILSVCMGVTSSDTTFLMLGCDSGKIGIGLASKSEVNQNGARWLPYLHGAAITGLVAEKDMVISVSVDRRILVMNVTDIDSVYFNVNVVHYLITNVADPSGIDLISTIDDDDCIVVVGCGIECLRMK